jgi:hypothetical protein
LKKTGKIRSIYALASPAVMTIMLVSCSLGTEISIPLYSELGGKNLRTFEDLAGDTFGSGNYQYDILSADVFQDRDNTQLVMHLTFNNPVHPPSTAGADDELVGYLEIDTDQDPGTGTPSFIDSYASSLGLPPANLGVEYGIDFFYYDTQFHTLSVYEGNMSILSGYARAIYGENTVTVQIPLAALGDDDGNIKFGFILGTFPEPTDMAYTYSYTLK